jgi:hypothetical protein
VDAVAEEIVKEIRERSGEKKSPQKQDDSSLFRKRIFSPFLSYAWADEITSVSNPTIRALKERIIARHIQWKPYSQKGMLKERNDGYVAIGNTQGLGLKEKRNLKNLVDAENRDRKKLYAEVAKALKIDASQISKIAKSFAKKWQE